MIRVGLTILFILTLFVGFASAELNVSYIDVGQGDSELLESGEHKYGI